MKKLIAIIMCIAVVCLLFAACATETAAETAEPEAAAEETAEEVAEAEEAAEEPAEAGEEPAAEAAEPALEKGIYLADFTTDSSMFHVNETLDGKGTLYVEDDGMYIHVTLVSQNILNLYPGLAADAEKEGAVLLEPTEDEVTYDDGTTEIAYGFDIPVPALDEEFDLAIIGTKGKWYDHKVSVSNPEPME